MNRSTLALACSLIAAAPTLADEQAAADPILRQTEIFDAQPRVIRLAPAGAAEDVRIGRGLPGTGVLFVNAVDAEIETIKAAYLGVSTSPLPPALAAQLKLPAGFGLVVDAVEKDGPAAAAIRQHDILVRLGDQSLINAHQLRALIRSHKPGDEVTLTLIREGKEQQVKVKLIEKEVPAHEPADLLPPLPGAGDLRWGAPLGPMRLDRATTSVRYADDEHVLEIATRSGQRTLIAKDKAGKVLFEGPVGTEEERRKVPQELLPKLEKLEKSARARAGARAGAVPGGVDLDLDLDFGALEKLLGKQLDNLPADADRQEIERRVREMQDKVRQQIRKMQEEFRKQRAAFDALDLAPLDPGQLPQPGAAGFQHLSAVSVASFSDGEHTLTIRTDDKGKTLSVKDKAGKEIFAGPINTPQERDAVPAELQEKLRRFENLKVKGGALRLRRGQEQPEQPPAAPRIDRDEDRQN